MSEQTASNLTCKCILTCGEGAPASAWQPNTSCSIIALCLYLELQKDKLSAGEERGSGPWPVEELAGCPSSCVPSSCQRLILLGEAECCVGLGIWLKVTNNFSFPWNMELDVATLANDCWCFPSEEVEGLLCGCVHVCARVCRGHLLIYAQRCGVSWQRKTAGWRGRA